MVQNENNWWFWINKSSLYYSFTFLKLYQNKVTKKNPTPLILTSKFDNEQPLLTKHFSPAC